MSAIANVLTMPAVAPKKRVVRSRCAHLEADQLEAFMTAAKAHGTREWAMFVFAFSHGARVSEICDLHWSDVNFHAKQVTIARKKHSLEQTQAFLKVKGSTVFDEEKALRAWQVEHPGDGDDFVLNSQRSTKRNRVTVWKLFAKIAEVAGLPASHRQRALGTLMAQKGASAFAIQQKLGHRSIFSTAVYCQPDKSTGRLGAGCHNESTALTCHRILVCTGPPLIWRWSCVSNAKNEEQNGCIVPSGAEQTFRMM